LVTGYAYVFILLSIVTVPYPPVSTTPVTLRWSNFTCHKTPATGRYIVAAR